MVILILAVIHNNYKAMKMIDNINRKLVRLFKDDNIKLGRVFI